jgi:hypothetical protein
MRSCLAIVLVGLCGAGLAVKAQPIEEVPARDAWLYAHNGFQMPRTVPGEKFDKVRYGMTLEEMVKLLGKAWMRPNSSIRDIYWGCEDGRVICIFPAAYRKNERTVKEKKDEKAPGAVMRMYREKNGKVQNIPVPGKGEGKEEQGKQNPNPEVGTQGQAEVPWQRPWYKANEPRQLKPEVFDKVRSGMTMGELVDLLGPIWLPSLGAMDSILWRCEDGRDLRAFPVLGTKEEVFRVDGGLRGIGKLSMTRLKDGRLVDVPIPPLPGTAK